MLGLQNVRGFIIRFLAVFLLIAPLSPLRAADMSIPAPKGEVLLTIDGAVTANGGAPVLVDLEALKSLPKTTFRTTTQWTEGEVEFTGVALKTLLQAAGATGGTLTATAINNYAVEMPVADLGDDAPIVA